MTKIEYPPISDSNIPSAYGGINGEVLHLKPVSTAAHHPIDNAGDYRP